MIEKTILNEWSIIINYCGLEEKTVFDLYQNANFTMCILYDIKVFTMEKYPIKGNGCLLTIRTHLSNEVVIVRIEGNKVLLNRTKF